MAKGKPVYVLIMTNLKMKPFIVNDSEEPDAVFKIEKYHKLSAWYDQDQKKAEETLLLHHFYVTFRSMYAARAYAKKYGTNLRNISKWAEKYGGEVSYMMLVE